MTIENKPASNWEMASLGMIRAALFFPGDHLGDRTKVECQLHTEKTSVNAIKDLWKSQGLKGLFSGSRANFIRRTARETYFWPVMNEINYRWKKILPEKINKKLITDLATGNSMALVHSVMLPFERLFIEKAAYGGYLPFLRKMMNSKSSMAYEGFQATFLRHSFVWNLFFLLDHGSNVIIKKIDSDKAHPHLSELGRAFMTSTSMVCIGYPVEFLRNRILLEPNVVSNGTLRGVKQLFQRYKWKKLYSGAPVMFVHNYIQTFCYQMLIDKINGKA